MDLTPFARKYIWWQSTERTLCDRTRLIAQVMDIGTHADAEALRLAVGDDEFKRTLREARAGQFSDRSWHYWHLILGLAGPHTVPRLPQRKLP